MKKTLFLVTLLVGANVVLAGPYNSGESITVLRDGSKCDAIVIMSGDEKSKIEYTERCQYVKNIFGGGEYHSQGYQEWVPNFALGK